VRKFLFLVPLVLLALIGLKAEPYMITATNYASGFFGVVTDESGQPLEVGSTVHLVWDSAGDGMDDPSTQAGSYGQPTGDDVLMGVGQVGSTGGAPSAGNFVVPGTVSAAAGFCYLRAFHAPAPQQGTWFSESLSQYALPAMTSPVIYGVQFPAVMNRQLGSVPGVVVAMTPTNPPLTIGPTGGNFQYTIEIQNTTAQPINYDLWIDAILPNGSVYGPIFTRPNLTMPGQTTWTRQMTQAVPAGAPPGVYQYQAHAGNMQTGAVIHQDGFPFQKQGAGGLDGLPPDAAGWQTTGWEGGSTAEVAIPDVFFLSPPYPNPFNPVAQIQFGLPQASEVQIDVYNILGSRVTTLLSERLEAGYHQVVWDAGRYASGLYLVKMKAGGFIHTEKAMLVK